MLKENGYNGNEYVDYILEENQINIDDMNNMINFINNHSNVYLYGKGMCGSGFKEYSTICGFNNVKGFITSDTVDEFLNQYEQGKDGIILTLKSDYYRDILPLLWGVVNREDILFLLEKTKDIFVRVFSKEYLATHMWLTLPMTKHCNINCASCNMFAPICKPECYTLEQVKKDLTIIKDIRIPLTKINITGGEPFLNPEIISVLKLIRETFPSTKIEFFTNAILADRLSDDELIELASCRAEFQITDYGIERDKLESVYAKFDHYNIDYRINYNDENKVFFKKSINFDGDTPAYEYISCQYYTFCMRPVLYNGKLYKCPLALNADNINNFFDKKLEVTSLDFLDINSVDTPDKIYDFWKSRLPMCRYCPRLTESVKWTRSKRTIDEWI